MEQKEQGFIKNSFAILGQLQSLISISYFLAVGIGMLFSYQKYSRFGINIFDYADIFDFIIAPFADFKVLLFSFGSIFFGLLIIQLDLYWKRKGPKSYSKAYLGLDKKDLFMPFQYSIYIFTILGYLVINSKIYGSTTREQIETEGKTIEVKFIDGDSKKGLVLGKTTEYLFMKSNGKTLAIPIKSTVKEIEIR